MIENENENEPIKPFSIEYQAAWIATLTQFNSLKSSTERDILSESLFDECRRANRKNEILQFIRPELVKGTMAAVNHWEQTRSVPQIKIN